MRLQSVLFLAVFLAASPAALAQEREWSTDETDTEAYLVFGVPESDDVGVSFWCKKESNIVRFFAPETDEKLKIANRVPFVLEVPPKSYRYKGKTTPNEESGSISLEAELKITDPIFPALEQATYFAVRIGKSKEVYPLQEANFQEFLRVCKSP